MWPKPLRIASPLSRDCDRVAPLYTPLHCVALCIKPLSYAKRYAFMTLRTERMNVRIDLLSPISTGLLKKIQSNNKLSDSNMHIYSAQERFTVNDDSWQSYIEWSGRTSATEIITFDGMLCSSAIDALIDEDWQHNIHADNMVYFFSDYEYLLKRIRFDAAKHNILELTKQPDSNVMPTESFRFCGYDIMDSDDSISVLLNCGPFPDIFSANDTNLFGLIDKLDDAKHIANNIRLANPDEHHCQDCRVWSIARYIG